MNLEEFVEDIIKLLEKGNNNYCFETAMLIGNCSSEKSVDLLVDAIERNKKRSEVVCDLVYALGSTSLESAVSPLVSLMKKTKDKKVYNRIVDALSKLGAKEALIPIITMLNETKLEWHHSRLIDGLGYIKSDDAVGFLIDLIKKTEDSKGDTGNAN